MTEEIDNTLTTSKRTEEANDNLGDLNPNIPFVKRDLINAGMRYGFRVDEFVAARLPDGKFKVSAELTKL